MLFHGHVYISKCPFPQLWYDLKVIHPNLPLRPTGLSVSQSVKRHRQILPFLCFLLVWTSVGSKATGLVVEVWLGATRKVKQFFLLKLDVAQSIPGHIRRMRWLVFSSTRWLRVCIVSGWSGEFLLHRWNWEGPHEVRFFGALRILELLVEAAESIWTQIVLLLLFSLLLKEVELLGLQQFISAAAVGTLTVILLCLPALVCHDRLEGFHPLHQPQSFVLEAVLPSYSL